MHFLSTFDSWTYSFRYSIFAHQFHDNHIIGRYSLCLILSIPFRSLRMHLYYIFSWFTTMGWSHNLLCKLRLLNSLGPLGSFTLCRENSIYPRPICYINKSKAFPSVINIFIVFSLRQFQLAKFSLPSREQEKHVTCLHSKLHRSLLGNTLLSFFPCWSSCKYMFDYRQWD